MRLLHNKLQLIVLISAISTTKPPLNKPRQPYISRALEAVRCLFFNDNHGSHFRDQSSQQSLCWAALNSLRFYHRNVSSKRGQFYAPPTGEKEESTCLKALAASLVGVRQTSDLTPDILQAATSSVQCYAL